MPIHLYLPDDYMNTQCEYPVLFMFDGHNLFNDEDATYGRSWRMKDYLDSLEHKIIVAGVECSHNGCDRLMEYAPFPFYDEEFGGSLDAHGDETMRFMIQELRPYLLEHFPVSAKYKETWIGGSSCGAIMALYALIRYSSIFSKAVALSPYINPSADSFMYLAGKWRPRRKSALYLSWGAREGFGGHEFVEETKNLTNLANILLEKKTMVHFHVKPHGIHCEEDWESEVPAFLQFLQQ